MHHCRPAKTRSLANEQQVSAVLVTCPPSHCLSSHSPITSLDTPFGIQFYTGIQMQLITVTLLAAFSQIGGFWQFFSVCAAESQTGQKSVFIALLNV